MDEQYIYLGHMSDTHFFIHTIANPTFEKTTSDQIYNVLIHEDRITDPKKNVIIYEFDVMNKEVYITIIQHITKEGGLIRFDPQNILEMLKPLVTAERSDMYLIRYSYEKECYESFEAEGDLIGANGIVVPEGIPEISEIREIATKKTFNSDSA
jgi:hypothetical protein